MHATTGIVLILLGVTALCHAGYEYKVFSDSSCANQVGYFWTSKECSSDPTVGCTNLEGSLNYYTAACPVTLTNAPAGWNVVTYYKETSDCTPTLYDYVAIKDKDQATDMIVFANSESNVNFNVSCVDKTMLVRKCPYFGDSCIFDVISYDTCASLNDGLYSARQSSCGAIAPVAAPGSAPTITPSTTPSKQSSASFAITSGSALLIAFGAAF